MAWMKAFSKKSTAKRHPRLKRKPSTNYARTKSGKIRTIAGERVKKRQVRVRQHLAVRKVKLYKRVRVHTFDRRWPERKANAVISATLSPIKDVMGVVSGTGKAKYIFGGQRPSGIGSRGRVRAAGMAQAQQKMSSLASRVKKVVPRSIAANPEGIPEGLRLPKTLKLRR